MSELRALLFGRIARVKPSLPASLSRASALRDAAHLAGEADLAEDHRARVDRLFLVARPHGGGDAEIDRRLVDPVRRRRL
jgi:hypothetical protein